MLPDFTGFYRFLPDFTGFYRILPDFTGFCRFLPDFTGVYRFLPRSAGSYPKFVATRGTLDVTNRLLLTTLASFLAKTALSPDTYGLPDFTGFYRFLPDFTGFCRFFRVLLGPTKRVRCHARDLRCKKPAASGQLSPLFSEVPSAPSPGFRLPPENPETQFRLGRFGKADKAEKWCSFDLSRNNANKLGPVAASFAVLGVSQSCLPRFVCFTCVLAYCASVFTLFANKTLKNANEFAEVFRHWSYCFLSLHQCICVFHVESQARELTPCVVVLFAHVSHVAPV